jgi:Ca2+-binding RTX toxin-like protein
MTSTLLPLLPAVDDILFDFAQSDDFWANLETAFGTSYDVVKTTELRNQWQSRNFSQLPPIEVLSGEVLGTAKGAYAVSTNKIYLSESFLNVAASESLVKVILEEIGHYVDAQINPVDSAGDEGAIFASLVLGETLSTQELQALKAEDDTAYVTLNGQQIQIEQANFTGTNGNDNITGTAGDDTISPLRGVDTVNGGAGNDLLIIDYSSNNYDGIYGYSFNNSGYFQAYYNSNSYDEVSFSNIERFQITGTISNDSFSTGNGDDTLTGGAGNDTIDGGDGNNTIDGGDGNDNLTAGNGNDTLTGGAGNDTIAGGDGNNTIDGGDGNDSLTAGNGNDTLTGGVGNDFLSAGEGNDSLTGGLGNDTLDAGYGNDTINGGDGIDYLVDDFTSIATGITFDTTGVTPIIPTGTSIISIESFGLTTGGGNDTIKLTGRFNDNLNTGNGDDTITPGLGVDTVNGGAGNDLLIIDYSSNNYAGITGYSYYDGYGYFQAYYNSNSYDEVSFSNIERFQITGTISNDSFSTGNGDDTLTGGAGNDTIDGGDGNDIITGVNPNSSTPGKGEEIDSLTGGAGSDKFILGDATWIGYDDGNTTNAGTSDYAHILDFNTIDDTIQLRGSSSDYLLSVSGSTTTLYINKPGSEPDELIAVINNQTALSLTASYFSYVSSPTLPSITLAVSPSSVTEDGTTNLVYTFTRTGVTTNPLTVNYTLGGTATLNTDYTRTGTTNTVTFAAGSSTATVTIDPTADTTVEPNETVILTLATGTGYTVGTTTAVTGTITNDDVTLPSITLAVSPSSVTELTGGQAS